MQPFGSLQVSFFQLQFLYSRAQGPQELPHYHCQRHTQLARAQLLSALCLRLSQHL